MPRVINKILLFFILSVFIPGCAEKSQKKPVDLQGHRGCRGLMPENSIPAMIKALQLGVNTLEMDVVISKDNKVLLSHDLVLSHEICRTDQGKEISEDDEALFNLYTMNYAEIKRCDCGTLPSKRFPGQEKIKVYKPLLAEVIDSVEKYLSEHSMPLVNYNIEIKSAPVSDEVFHPRTAEFAERVIDVVKEKGISERVIVQSFDVRPLQSVRKKYPEIRLSLLVENRLGPEKNIEKLGFFPDIYSPNHLLVNEEMMKFCKENNMRVIPWTVNEKEEILSVLKNGVDGIITDYPDKAKVILDEFMASGE